MIWYYYRPKSQSEYNSPLRTPRFRVATLFQFLQRSTPTHRILFLISKPPVQGYKVSFFCVEPQPVEFRTVFLITVAHNNLETRLSIRVSRSIVHYLFAQSDEPRLRRKNFERYRIDAINIHVVMNCNVQGVGVVLW